MKKLIIIAGPTAVGKSDLAIDLAQRFNGEIISADSMQIYRGLDIGSAKVSPAQQSLVPHHMIDRVDPKDAYSAAQYQEDAQKILADLWDRGKLPLVVGGTGLYISGLIYDMNFANALSDPAIRARLELEGDVLGYETLWNRLNELDPVSAERIHVNNRRRVVRALEVMEITGKAFSDYRQDKVLRKDLQVHYFWLNRDRQALYRDINARVDQMMAQGLFEEVRGLVDQGLSAHHQAMQGIGYKELLPVILEGANLEEALDQLKQNSRNYAKRQITWFKNDPFSKELNREVMTDDEITFTIEKDIDTI